MRLLIGYALDGGADAVLLGCSMYGPVAEEFAAERPVLSSDAALFGEVVRLAPKRVHVLGPIEAGTRDTVESLQATVGAAAAVFGSVVTGVREARAEGDTERAARLAAKRAPARARFPGADMSTLVVGSERFHIHRITGLAPAGRPCTPRIVLENLRRHHQDVCLGTDSHTTMVNGLGVLGWGIEAEAAMFGHSLSMLVSPVVAPTAWSASSSSSPRGLTTSSPLRRPCRARRVPGKVSTPANSKPARKLPKLLPGQRKH